MEALLIFLALYLLLRNPLVLLLLLIGLIGAVS